MKIVGQVEHKAGTLVDVAVTISPLYDAAGDLVGACGVARDITEELQAQRDLFAATRRALEAEKLASIATLAAGIAHDIGAPMTAILGYAQMMQNSLPDEKNRRRAGIIVEQLNRITELVQALLNMSRPSQTVSVEVDLASVIDKSLELYHEMLRSRGIKVQRSFARVPAVAGDPNRLQQACLTLIANAADAMKDGGQLSLELSCANAGFVEIRIVDSGVGIAPEHLNRIFEPFYTTKEHGQGTGLGLLVAKGIVEEHTGRISVESTPDHGTTFTISLPVIET